MEKHWMIVGGWWWGKAETLSEAIANAKRNAGSDVNDNGSRRFIYKVDPATYINDFGGITYPGGTEEPEKIAELPVGVKVNLNTLAKILV